MPLSAKIPLSLYIHLPWCLQKCPYCDFNSHALQEKLPEEIYVSALLQDLAENIAYFSESILTRPIESIFFGGGTPSLFSAQAIAKILGGVQKYLTLSTTAEITLEANPGAMEQQRFKDYRAAGVNRLSIGVQSLQNDKLKRLGRIHDREAAIHAVQIAKAGGFDNINVDLMYGLPQQTLAEALQDVQEALALQTSHFSWYQLTIEPNTAFHHAPPMLPAEEAIWQMQVEGQALLQTCGFKQYEVSAYSKNAPCRHNLNYWQFGDYLGLGAGAHSKITDYKKQIVTRHWQVKNPRDYLDAKKNKTAQRVTISQEDLIFEFMLNALRLVEGIPVHLFTERTGLTVQILKPQLTAAYRKGLLENQAEILKTTELGRRFLNDLVSLFLISKKNTPA